MPSQADVFYASEDMYKSIIGRKNQSYYLVEFQTFDRKKSLISWNWAACLATTAWLAYRKMWSVLFLYYLVFGAAILAISTFSPDDAIVFTFGISYIIPPLYANKLYHFHCRRKIAKVLITVHDPSEQLAAMSAKGGVSIGGLVFIFLLFLVVRGPRLFISLIRLI